MNFDFCQFLRLPAAKLIIDTRLAPHGFTFQPCGGCFFIEGHGAIIWATPDWTFLGSVSVANDNDMNVVKEITLVEASTRSQTLENYIRILLGVIAKNGAGLLMA